MTYALFLLLTGNLILRLNDYVPGFTGFPIVEVMLPVLLGLWLLFEKKDFTLATDLLLPTFFFIVVIGYALTVWPAGAPDIARGLAPWVAVYFLAANLVRTPRRTDWFLAMLLLCALVLVAHSVQQRLNYDGENDATGVGWSGATLYQGRARYVGVVNDPNDLALYFALVLPVALQLLNRARMRARLAGLVACPALLFGIFLTGSRGGVLAAGVVGALFAYRRWGWPRTILLCLMLAAVMFAYGPSRISESNASDEASTQGRLDAWYAGLRMFEQHPLLGVGKDRFVEYNVLTAHNSFVLCFAETGLVGYLLWFGINCYALYGLHKIVKRTLPGTDSHRLACTLFDALIGFYVSGFFLSRTYYILFPILIGLAVARFKAARDEQAEYEAGADAAAYPADLLPDAAPLPDLSWRSLGFTLPRITGLALLSIAIIYFVTKI